jgi:hypothetical protein
MARKYDYLTKEIAYPIISRYFKSGVGLASTFYRQEGLSEGQFYTWRKRYMQEHNIPFPVSPSSQEPHSSFHPIRISSPPLQSSEDKYHRIELEYPNGVILRIEGLLHDGRLSSLIKLY